jgi:hypothetical protein
MAGYSGTAVAGGGFNPFAAGTKHYGGGRTMPTMGRVNPLGYKQRDAQAQARRNAILSRIKANQQGNYASPNANRSLP